MRHHAKLTPFYTLGWALQFNSGSLSSSTTTVSKLKLRISNKIIDIIIYSEDLTKPKVYRLGINPLSPRDSTPLPRSIYQGKPDHTRLDLLTPKIGALLRRQSSLLESSPSATNASQLVEEVGQDYQDGAVTDTDLNVQINNLEGQGAAFFVGNTSNANGLTPNNNTTKGFITGVRFGINTPALSLNQLNQTAILEGVMQANSTGPVSYVVVVTPSTFLNNTLAVLDNAFWAQFTSLEHLFHLNYSLGYEPSLGGSPAVSYEFTMNATDYTLTSEGRNLTNPSNVQNFVPSGQPADTISGRRRRAQGS